jgi:quercetin dioxygenase-like cupin family protein
MVSLAYYMATTMNITNDKAGELIQLGQLEVIFYAEGGDTDGHLDLYEVRVQPGARVPSAHHHVDTDETIYGLEGVMTYVVGEDLHEIRAGERAFSPRGVTHYFGNRGASVARMLVCGTPGTLGAKYFRAIQALMAASAGGPPDLGKLAGVMRAHGLEPRPLPAVIAPRI